MMEVMLQLCTEDIWQGTMEQITRLGIQPTELPEEALTQIYQVRLPQATTSCHPGLHADMHNIQRCACNLPHGDSQSCSLRILGGLHICLHADQPHRNACSFMPDKGLICRPTC